MPGYTPPTLTPKQKKQEQAQELFYDALEAPDPAARLMLIEKARKLDPDNVDILCFTAADSPDIQSMITNYKQAANVGEERLGIEMEEMRGHFWGFHETRPFMRAKAGLVNALLFDETLEAIGHLWHMLDLNTSDNQGMRYILATALLDTGNLSSYADLLKRFPDDTMSAWLYNHALYLFKLHGDSPKSTAKVYEAISRNRHIPALLVGKKKLPTESYDYVILGDVSEAVEYVKNNQRVWGLTRNAMDWLWDIARK